MVRGLAGSVDGLLFQRRFQDERVGLGRDVRRGLRVGRGQGEHARVQAIAPKQALGAVLAFEGADYLFQGVPHQTSDGGALVRRQVGLVAETADKFILAVDHGQAGFLRTVRFGSRMLGNVRYEDKLVTRVVSIGQGFLKMGRDRSDVLPK